MDNNSKARNGSNIEDEQIRQRGEKIKGDLASSDPSTQQKAEEKVQDDNLADLTSNGHPPKNEPGSHRRH